jgi:hypothetical protein
MKPALTLPLAIAALVVLAAPAQGQPTNTFAPVISFEEGNTSWGIENTNYFNENFSLRSRVSFANSAPNSGTRYRAALNYSFASGDEAQAFSPFLGLGVDYNSGSQGRTTGFAQAGLDMYFDDLVLTGSVALPFDSNSKFSTSIGLGFRF